VWTTLTNKIDKLKKTICNMVFFDSRKHGSMRQACLELEEETEHFEFDPSSREFGLVQPKLTVHRENSRRVLPKQEGENPGVTSRRNLLSKAIHSSSRLLNREGRDSRKSTKSLFEPNKHEGEKQGLTSRRNLLSKAIHSSSRLLNREGRDSRKSTKSLFEPNRDDQHSDDEQTSPGLSRRKFTLRREGSKRVMPEQEGETQGPTSRRNLLSKAIHSSSRRLIWEGRDSRKSTKSLFVPNKDDQHSDDEQISPKSGLSRRKFTVRREGSKRVMPKQEGEKQGPTSRRNLLSKAIHSSSRRLTWEGRDNCKSTKSLFDPTRQNCKSTKSLLEPNRQKSVIRKSSNTRQGSMDAGATVEETLAILLERELSMMDC
jgi:hypothetical protein